MFEIDCRVSSISDAFVCINKPGCCLMKMKLSFMTLHFYFGQFILSEKKKVIDMWFCLQSNFQGLAHWDTPFLRYSKYTANTCLYVQAVRPKTSSGRIRACRWSEPVRTGWFWVFHANTGGHFPAWGRADMETSLHFFHRKCLRRGLFATFSQFIPVNGHWKSTFAEFFPAGSAPRKRRGGTKQGTCLVPPTSSSL